MAEGSMTWTEVADRLAEARTYWLGSTTASGAPHAAPVWGVVTGETLYLYSERSTVKARNLAAKYTRPQDQQYLPDHDPDFDVVWAIRPRSAMAWQLDDYDASQRRWSPLW
jgi:hypothetical protein